MKELTLIEYVNKINEALKPFEGTYISDYNNGIATAILNQLKAENLLDEEFFAGNPNWIFNSNTQESTGPFLAIPKTEAIKEIRVIAVKWKYAESNENNLKDYITTIAAEICTDISPETRLKDLADSLRKQALENKLSVLDKNRIELQNSLSEVLNQIKETIILLDTYRK